MMVGVVGVVGVWQSTEWRSRIVVVWVVQGEGAVVEIVNRHGW